ncbi:chaperone [Lithospermum erythrorhizon]|uniref:Chaperone n=1 Tax=Lithospermum erythrorhizon TaxID=34254 RepID=A0AAV3Q5H0_LITER
MLSRWSKTMSKLYGSHKISEISSVSHALTWRTFSNAAAEEAEAESPFSDESTAKIYSEKPQVNLNKMFWSKPCSLALHPDSPLRSEDPQYEGLKRLFLTMMLFYSKQSRSIRGANVIYRRVLSQIDKPAIYDVFSLEKTFRTTFSILVLHMWLCLRRLREDGKEGVELGQYLYEIYNHDLELRVSRAGVNLLLSKWMKDLERIFYGNIVALDAAILPEAKQDELQNVIWRNVFSDDSSPKPNAAALPLVQAMSRYIRREYSCMSLTDREAIFSGNFMFTPLDSKTAGGQ